jgi:hypothetical protein
MVHMAVDMMHIILTATKTYRFRRLGSTRDPKNGSLPQRTSQEWSQRAQPSWQFYGTGYGVPVEVMLSLANLMGMDSWLCIPHQASDAYVQACAHPVWPL